MLENGETQMRKKITEQSGNWIEARQIAAWQMAVVMSIFICVEDYSFHLT